MIKLQPLPLADWQSTDSWQAMPHYTVIILAGIICLLSSLAFTVNYIYFQYLGNNYFPTQMPAAGLGLILMLTGIYLLYGKRHILIKICAELIYYFFIVSLIALLTNAAQYTPFKPIDASIIRFEQSIGIQLTAYMAWAHQYPFFIEILHYAYSSLTLQLAVLPLLIIAMNKTARMRSYYILVMSCSIMGFMIYYFFPTTAPASLLHSPYFLHQQYDTAVKFYQIHNSLPVTTDDGGMVAFPSFHVIWGWLCVYLAKDVRWLWMPLVLINGLLTVSCVLLGWHYVSDIVGSMLVLLLSFIVLYISQRFNKGLR